MGAVISYEEYHPYGTTSYRANNAAVKACAKRYRYTGKEKDEESGLYYHGARYYIPWLGRWTACDPKEGERAGLSPYDYCSNNPINRTDDDGMKDEPKGSWYEDKKGAYQFIEGVTSKSEFEESEYKDKGAWFGTFGAAGGGDDYSKDPYVNLNEDGSQTLNYISGKEVVIPFKGNAKLQKDSRTDYKPEKSKALEVSKAKGVESAKSGGEVEPAKSGISHPSIGKAADRADSLKVSGSEVGGGIWSRFTKSVRNFAEKTDRWNSNLGNAWGNAVNNSVIGKTYDEINSKMGKHTDSYLGNDGFIKHGWPTMKATFAVLGTVISGGAFGAWYGTAAMVGRTTIINGAGVITSTYGATDNVTKQLQGKLCH